MLSALTFILFFQVVGEIISNALHLPVPGPVLGMILLLFAFFLKDNLINTMRPTSGVLLSNLSLLFVPAGVGIMRQGERFMSEGLGIMAVLVISTVLAMLATAYTIVHVQRWLKLED